jgi:nickel-dependent lactate racemase
VVKPSFSVSSVVDERGRAIWIYAGHWRAAHRAGCIEYLANHSLKIGPKRDLVIVSCGGSPYDIKALAQAYPNTAGYILSRGAALLPLAESN